MCKFLYKILYHRQIGLFGLIHYLSTFKPANSHIDKRSTLSVTYKNIGLASRIQMIEVHNI